MWAPSAPSLLGGQGTKGYSRGRIPVLIPVFSTYPGDHPASRIRSSDAILVVINVYSGKKARFNERLEAVRYFLMARRAEFSGVRYSYNDGFCANFHPVR